MKESAAVIEQSLANLSLDTGLFEPSARVAGMEGPAAAANDPIDLSKFDLSAAGLDGAVTPQIVIDGPIAISNYNLTIAGAAQISSLVALVGFAAEGLKRMWRYIWSS